MKTNKLKIFKVNVPTDFPTEPFVKIFQIVANQIDSDERYSKTLEFALAWESFAHRFTTLTYNDCEFSSSLKRYGFMPENFNDKEIQDLSAFAFFTNAQSSIESICYALYILGSLKKPIKFPRDSKTLKKLTPNYVKNKFHENFTSEPISYELTLLVDSLQYQEIGIIRNSVIHRSLPDRRRRIMPMRFKNSPFQFAVPLDSWIISGQIIDKERSEKLQKKVFKDHNISVSTEPYRDWLSKSTKRLLESIEQFALKDFAHAN